MAGIGSTLREAREGAHLDIVDFEFRTKIRAKYLRAMEEEQWSLLPGYTFTKGFLRTYADMLGLDGRALVDEFKRQYRDPSELELAPAQPARRGDRSRRAPQRPRSDAGERGGERAGRARPPGAERRPPIAVAVVVLVVLLAAALYAVGVLAGHKGTATATQTQTSTTPGHPRTHKHKHKPPPKATTLSKVGVRLDPTGTVYVCMIGYPTSSSAHEHIRIDGETLTPGMREPVYHDDHFHVTFGNASVVMYVNDHRHAIAPSAEPISLDILRNGSVHALPQRDLPHCT